VALHASVIDDSLDICGEDNPNENRIPCDDYITETQPLETTLAVYVVAVAPNGTGVVNDGIGGVSFGIAYESEPLSGVDILDWTLCADVEFPLSGPNGDWPASNSGNRVAWDSVENCQRQLVGVYGIHAIVGAFLVEAHSSDVLKVTPNMPFNGKLVLYECHAVPAEAALPGGWVGFGSFPGFNPCTGDEPPIAVESTTWGAIKQLSNH
jgi:hypothetical protein